jgi:hypothetical protein
MRSERWRKRSGALPALWSAPTERFSGAQHRVVAREHARLRHVAATSREASWGAEKEHEMTIEHVGT